MADYANEGKTVVNIPAFRGLLQYGDGVGSDARYAVECANALVKEGVLRPMTECRQLPGGLKEPIETLARLHRRYHTLDREKDVLIAASGGQLYWRLPAGESWQRIPMPPTFLGEEYRMNRWSWVAYEINPEGREAPVDVLLMSNALDGMICIRGDELSASVVETPRKFGVIARHAERIWGGAVMDDPDMLAYSAPYDPFDWRQNNDIPEDGAGDVLQPSWDGDSFTALTSFGSQLMAFKRTRAWRVLGTDPGVYTFKEQYGGGVRYADTIAVDDTRILMLGREGVCQYNGESVEPCMQEYAQAVFERMNPDALEKACACIWRGTYYCAIPLDESPVNNAVLLYDTVENTWTLREGVEVDTFLPTEDTLFFSSSQNAGSLWKWQEDSLQTGEAVSMRWVGPWQDLGKKNLIKGGFALYLTVECSQPVTLHVGVETEKRRRLKKVVFHPPVSGHARQKRVALGGSGRRFRLVLESEDTAAWSLPGGVQLETESCAD